MLKNPDSRIPWTKLAVLHKAGVEAWDSLDGLKDGLIGDPETCHFDPAVLLCNGADANAGREARP
jgi:feruloyl esterase